MSIQLGNTKVAPRAQASFLHGGIAARYLPSADVTPFVVRRATLVHAVGTQGVNCSVNPHIPACQAPTSHCTVAGPQCGPTPTGSFCPTREFVC